MGTARDVARTFEHHVLEKMSKSRAARDFICRTHVVPQIYRDHRQAVILGKDDDQAALQFVFFEFELRDLEPRGPGSRFLCLRGGGSRLRALRRSLWRNRLLPRGCAHKKQERYCSQHQDTLVMRLHQSFLSNEYRLTLTAGPRSQVSPRNPT